MCGRRLKTILSLSVLVSLSLCSPCSTYLCAEVRLTDEEASELMNEVQQSKEELQNVKKELSESQNDLTGLENQLTDVKNTYEEQKKYYETQLNEAEKENQKLKIATSVTGGSALTLLVVVALLIIF